MENYYLSHHRPTGKKFVYKVRSSRAALIEYCLYWSGGDWEYYPCDAEGRKSVDHHRYTHPHKLGFKQIA